MDNDETLDKSLLQKSSDNSVGKVYFDLCGLAVAWALTLTTSTLLTTVGDTINLLYHSFKL